jgi:MoaA/NifB/PqqE/SkfB family radical SAM enzyme
MTPDLIEQYRLASQPFISGAITDEVTKTPHWRVFLEINSACTLKCPTCTKGNQEAVDGLKYDHKTGFMDEALMERILDKIKMENPNAIVFCYGNSEPFVHPKLPECIAAIKRRGLHPEMSTNLNHVHRVDEVLEAGPDLIIVSLSGFTQETYVKGHAGGNIEKVKANMKILGDANNARPKEKRVKILVNYHVYNDNAHEIDEMQAYAKSCHLELFTSFARAISMENAVQYCRSKDPDATPFEVQEGRPDWNAIFPKVSQQFVDTMDRLFIPPTKAREIYQHIPIRDVCPVGAGGMFTFIRHDGKTSMCACVADRRITVGDFMDTTAEQMIEQRTGHSVCKQCIKYRQNLAFHIVPGSDGKNWY